MSDLLTRAKEIKNATEIGENTAERVGGVLVDTVNEITSLQERAVNHEDTLTTHGKQISALQTKVQDVMYTNTDQQTAINSQGTRLTEVEHRADEHGTQIAKVQDEKAPKVGYAPDLKVNFAKELVGRGEATPQVIGKIRPTGEISIGDGNATIDKIKGNSVVWNQQSNNAVIRTTEYGITVEYQDGVVRVHGTATLPPQNGLANIRLGRTHRKIPQGNRVLVSSNNTLAQCRCHGFETAYNTIFSANSATMYDVVLQLNLTEGVSVDETIKPVIYDLTQMFGAGNEPTTIEEFEARRPFGVTDDYNEGEIISYDGANELQSIGFNAYNGTYAKVIGGQKYHALGNITSIGFAKEMGGETTEVTLDSDGMFTPTEDGYVYADGTDICIHLAHTYTPEHNTEYEEDTLQLPDVKSIKDKDGNSLFPYGLLSAGSVHDEITATKAIKRIDVVDMGSLIWKYSESIKAFYAIISTKVKDFGKLITPRYYYKGANSTNNNEDKLIYIYSKGLLRIRDLSYTDPTAFKESLQGVLLYYELAEPIEVDLEEPLNLTYDAWDFGTEELHTDAKTTPLNADISYQFNAVDRIRENTTKASDLEARIVQLEAMLTQMAQANNEA